MKKLDLFLLKSFLGPFVMTFFITVFILVMQFLWLYIDELVGKGLSFWVIMEFLGWGSPPEDIPAPDFRGLRDKRGGVLCLQQPYSIGS